MRWKEYDYTGQWGRDGHIAYRPLTEVRVACKGRENNGMAVVALIDSGTDSTLLDIDVAKTLGIDLMRAHKVKVGGVGERDGFVSDITLLIPDFDVSMNIPVVFTDGLPFSCLLGQRHFFERFQVRFEKNRNKFFVALSPQR